MAGSRRLTLIVTLTLLGLAPAHRPLDSQAVLTVGDYELVSSRPLGKKATELTYRARLTNAGPALRAVPTAVAETPSARARWAKRRRLTLPAATCRNSSSSSPGRPAGVHMFLATKTSFVTWHTPLCDIALADRMTRPCASTPNPDVAGKAGDALQVAGVAPTIYAPSRRLAVFVSTHRLTGSRLARRSCALSDNQ